MGKHSKPSPVQVTVVNKATGKTRVLTSDENDHDYTDAAPDGKHRHKDTVRPS